jgi:aminotransferase
MKTSSKRIQGLVQSDIRAMTIECIKHKGINLGQGLCETETPEIVIQAARESLMMKNRNTYSSPEGVSELRTRISEKLKQENAIHADPQSEIIVTHGATGGYAATLMALLDPGDGILFFQPYYGYHVNAAILAQLEPQYVEFTGLEATVTQDVLQRSVRPNTKAIVVCTPNNPSGKMWSEAEIAVLAEFAQANDLLVITDEMYEYFRYAGRPHLSPAADLRIWERSVNLMGLSKTFSITGWRLGYLSAPKALAEKIRIANDLFYVCAPVPLQHAVAAGFTLTEEHFTKMQSEFQSKRDRLCHALTSAGFKVTPPAGAYYILADTSAFGTTNSKDFAMNLLAQVGVAGIPGRAFFKDSIGEQYIRFNFALQDDVLSEACTRLQKFKGPR